MDAAVSIQTILSLLVGVVGFFLVRTLNRVEKEIKDNSDRISEHGAKILLIESSLSSMTKELKDFGFEFEEMEASVRDLKSEVVSLRATIVPISDEWVRLRDDILQQVAYLKMSRDLSKEVAILTRDRDAAFKRIDELRQTIAARNGSVGEDV